MLPPPHPLPPASPDRTSAPTGAVDLAPFFDPRRLVVVGASDTEGRPATGTWRFLVRWAEHRGADIVAVNPHRATVDGRPCVADLTALDGPVDVVAVLVSDAAPVVREAVAIGARFVVVFSSGYAETGPEGVAAQAELAAIVAGSGTRLLGPNTNLNAFEVFRTDLDGPALALVSQSGHQGRPVFLTQRNGVRVDHWAPTGNEADLEAADFVSWFARQPAVGAIAAYLEGIKDGAAFRAAAETCVAQATPLVLVKVGRTEAGTRAATSHTGKLAGTDAVTDAVCRRYGITRVDELDELADVAMFLARVGGEEPRSDGVAIYSISGGTGAHVADLAVSRGLRLATIADDTQRRLHELIPADLQVSNPVDCGGHPAGDERGRPILDLLVAEPDVGALLVVVTGPFPPLSDRLAADLADLAETAPIPIAVVWGSPVGDEPALRDTLYASSRLAVFRRTGNALLALRSWVDWQRFRSGYRPDAATAPTAPIGHGASTVGAGALDEHRSKQAVAAAGIPVTDDTPVRTPDEARAAVADRGGRAVVKAGGPHLGHKSEHGLVEVGVSADDAAAAFTRLRDRAVAVDPTRAEDVIVLVCELVDRDGIELLVGVSADPVFGPVVTIGAGGTLVELLDDTEILLPPFDRADVEAGLDRLRVAPLLAGHRGGRPLARDRFVDVVLAVQALATDPAARLVELDLNPVMVGPNRVVALDALVVLGPDT